MGELLVNLATDVVAITVVAYGIYFRRYYRRDLLLAYFSLNVGVFAVTALLADGTTESASASACSASCRSSGCVPTRSRRRRSPTTSSLSRSA